MFQTVNLAFTPKFLLYSQYLLLEHHILITIFLKISTVNIYTYQHTEHRRTQNKKYYQFEQSQQAKFKQFARNIFVQSNPLELAV